MLKKIKNLILSLSIITSVFLGCLLGKNEPEISRLDPNVLVIFGATGDLTARKLLPSLYTLSNNSLSEDTVIVGIGRRDYTNEIFREKVREAIKEHSKEKINELALKKLEEKVFYFQMSFDEEERYIDLQEKLKTFDSQYNTKGNRLYYLATQPSYFSLIAKNLKKADLIYDKDSSSWSRVIIEKPFGHDLQSALVLQKELSQNLDQSQTYHVDHYLGKKGVLDLVSLRLDHKEFEHLWNKEHIEKVEISISEDLGIEGRAKFWEETGYARDITQNHMMQILSLVAMETPSKDSTSIHKEKEDLLNALAPLSDYDLTSNVIRAQYTSGVVKGKEAAGYLEEEGIPSSSKVETYLALKLFIDNERWKDVPFILKGGKRLDTKETKVVIHFKDSKKLYIRIQPDPQVLLIDKDIETTISWDKPEVKLSEYALFISEAIKGNQSLFVTEEEQIASWKLLTPILNTFENDSSELASYKAGVKDPFSFDL